MYAIGAASPTRILVRNILVYPPALSLLHIHYDFYITCNNLIRHVILCCIYVMILRLLQQSYQTCNSYAAKKQYNSNLNLLVSVSEFSEQLMKNIISTHKSSSSPSCVQCTLTKFP
jgi:hypothetical protein